MSYSLTDETSIDTLIFWIESSDGSISYEEQKAVQRILDNMRYDMSTFQNTLSHISAMSTEHLQELIEEAISHVKRNFSDDGKRLTYQLLETIAGSNGDISKAEQEKLTRLKSEFGG